MVRVLWVPDVFARAIEVSLRVDVEQSRGLFALVQRRREQVAGGLWEADSMSEGGAQIQLRLTS